MAPPGLLVAGASFLAFRGLHWGLRRLPESAARDRWQWRNLCISLAHSLLSGAGALLGLSLYPRWPPIPIHGHLRWALVLVAVSVGYFLADGAALLWNQTLGKTWDLLCHHLVNGVALFRLVLLGWMSLWLFQQRHQVPLALVTLGGIGLVTVGVMSIILGICILVNDVLQSRPHPASPGHEKTRGTRTRRDDGPVTRDSSTLSLKDWREAVGPSLGEVGPGQGDEGLPCTFIPHRGEGQTGSSASQFLFQLTHIPSPS
ncbi:TLC domain-containing protein 2 [Symphalangus syndactylus]|uniref:TLC domain-containing protein 2 n=1 Tax=Symphalangus syndactylus TaxID=9590 RepID=UPI0030040CF3